MKHICVDMSGVLTVDTWVWMDIHKAFGTYEKGMEYTEKYLHTDYNMLVQKVVKELWFQRDATPYYDLMNSIKYHPHIKEFFDHLAQKGYKISIITASSVDIARRIQKEFRVDNIIGNELVIKDGKVSGDFYWPIGAGHDKLEVLKNLCSLIGVSLEETIYVGDTSKEIECLRAAGVGIAFNAEKDEVKEAANIIVEGNDLANLIPHIN